MKQSNSESRYSRLNRWLSMPASAIVYGIPMMHVYQKIVPQTHYNRSLVLRTFCGLSCAVGRFGITTKNRKIYMSP